LATTLPSAVTAADSWYVALVVVDSAVAVAAAALAAAATAAGAAAAAAAWRLATMRF